MEDDREIFEEEIPFNEPEQDEEIPFSTGDDEDEIPFNVVVERDPDLQEWEHDRIIITIATYRKFMALDDGTGLWTDAYLLYSHFYFTARVQKTNQIWANRKYCKKGLHWGSEKFKKAFEFLIKHEFIEQVRQEKVEKGQFPKVYIKVNYLSNSTVVPDKTKVDENGTVVLKPFVPDKTTKCLKDTSNTYVEGSNEPQKTPPDDSQIMTKIVTFCKNFKIPTHERDAWVKRHEPRYVLAQLQYVNEYQKMKPIDGLVQFIQAALINDYAKKNEADEEAWQRDQEAAANRARENQEAKEFEAAKKEGIPPECREKLDALKSGVTA